MATLFTRIIEGELPGTFVWRDETCVAFMTINPITQGHTLVVPIDEVDHWVDASPELNAHLMAVSQQIARAISAEYDFERVATMIAGLEVPHLHVHVLGINTIHDMDFKNAATSIDPDALAENAGRIRAALRAQGAAGVAES